MVKIVFSNGEEIEWTGANLPDHVSIHFNPPSQEPVPDRISADHIESLCNILLWALQTLNNQTDYFLEPSKSDRYLATIRHARERAHWLREGKG